MGSLSDPTKEKGIPPGIHLAVHEEEKYHPGHQRAVVMASFRKGVKDPDLLKTLSRRQLETVKDLFDMADKYASQCNTSQCYCIFYLCFVHLIKQKHKQVHLNSYKHLQMQSF